MLRFYCYFIFGMWLCFDSIVFYLGDVITLWFYCFLSWVFILGRDYALILLFFYLGMWLCFILLFFIFGTWLCFILLFFIFGTWLCFDSIVILSLGCDYASILLSCKFLLLQFYYFISLVLLFFSLNFSFFQHFIK